jgi:ATP-dependent RNA helicase DeaD
LLNLAGIDAVWGTAPAAEEIRKLDQQRMLSDALFTDETTAEDLALAQVLLGERSPEDIAVALARLYRARLPSPEDILDAGERGGRSREGRGQERDGRSARGEERDTVPRSKPRKSLRDGMPEGSVWFRAAIGRRKNAEARWLLPMICRRGGVEKQDIGAIRILDTTTEFEISQRVAESFAVKIKRPDKEDSIRIEAMADAPGGQARSEKPPHTSRHEGKGKEERRYDKPHDERKPKQPSKPHGDSAPRFDREASSETRKRHQNKPAYAGQARRDGGPAAKPAFAKKPKKKFRG